MMLRLFCNSTTKRAQGKKKKERNTKDAKEGEFFWREGEVLQGYDGNWMKKYFARRKPVLYFAIILEKQQM